MAKARAGRLRLPNTRFGAIGAVAALTVVGFLIGIILIVVAPMVRAGRGPFALLKRGDPPAVDARRLLSQPSLGAQEKGGRPELWVTPTARVAFPSDSTFAALSGGAGVGKVTYTRAQDRRILPVPPIKDALGRASLAVVVTMGQEDDARTPGPYRPDAVEVTQLTIAASAPGQVEPSGCVLTIAGASELRATGAFGAAEVGACQGGRLGLPSNGAIGFAVRYDLLPNYRGRDGVWRDGGVFGRTEVVVAAGG